MKDDLISRQAAIDAVAEGLKRIFVENQDIAEKMIGGLPSAQPEPTTEIQEILNYLDTTLHPIVSPDNWNVYAELHDMVSKLPSAQSEPQWIPCSKKLPEPNQSVLVQPSDDFVDPILIMTFNISKCEGDFFYFWRTLEMGIDFDMDAVVAWMPLPKPWEGGQDGM